MIKKMIKKNTMDYVVLAIELLAMSGTMTIVDEIVKAIIPPNMKTEMKVAVKVANIVIQLMAANQVGGYVASWGDAIKTVAKNVGTDDQKEQVAEEPKN